MTACVMLRNESSISVMSLACLATLVPLPNDSPTWARFRAGASLVPSPVTATTAPRSCSSRTKRCLSDGRARDITFSSLTTFSASSSLMAANSAPVIVNSGLSIPDCESKMPACRAISNAVTDVSPVTILTSMPACRHCLMAAGTSLRSGSLMATMANRAAPSSPPWLGEATAMANVRMACFCHSRNWVSAACCWSSLSRHIFITISGAPLIYMVSPTVVVIYFRSVENASLLLIGFSCRNCW